jgi:succinylglutamate desuccinylase
LKRLSDVSEEENYAVKNRYLHQKRTMDFADKSRMPVDERKVKDMLRHQHEFRRKIEDDVPNYESLRRDE